MLNGINNGPVTFGKEAGRCKPDYEAQIKSLRAKVDAVVAFQKAMLAYESPPYSGRTAELFGELCSTEIFLDRSIDSLIERQEEDRD